MTQSPTYYLAQLNIARMVAPLTDPIMAGFVARLADINALADRSPGFVWRLQSAEGDATSVRAYDDEHMLVNLSVWESLEALKAYVYQSDHGAVMRDRRQWFEKFDGPYMVLWWIPAGQIPTVGEAKARLEHLQQHGESAYAFTFREIFQAEG